MCTPVARCNAANQRPPLKDSAQSFPWIALVNAAALTALLVPAQIYGFMSTSPENDGDSLGNYDLQGYTILAGMFIASAFLFVPSASLRCLHPRWKDADARTLTNLTDEEARPLETKLNRQIAFLTTLLVLEILGVSALSFEQMWSPQTTMGGALTHATLASLGEPALALLTLRKYATRENLQDRRQPLLLTNGRV